MLENNRIRTESYITRNEKKFIVIASVCSTLIILLTLFDILIGTSLGGDLNAIPQTAIERFVQLQSQPWLGLYYLDLMNLTTTILMVPVFIVLIHLMNKGKSLVLSITILVFTIGTFIFVLNNAALPMYGLSQQFVKASVSQKELLVAAGERYLARGAHGSIGVFPGFALCNLASILLSICMIQGNQFSRSIGIIGLIGTSLLMVYLILVTFIPDTKSIAMALAAPGGILSLIWMILYTKQLYRLSFSKNSS